MLVQVLLRTRCQDRIRHARDVLREIRGRLGELSNHNTAPTPRGRSRMGRRKDGGTEEEEGRETGRTGGRREGRS